MPKSRIPGNPPLTGPFHGVPPDYEVRFIAKRDQAELVNLYHLARTALSGRETEGGRTYRHNRMLYASSEFHKAHPEVSVTGAYKDLDGLLAWD